MALVAGDREAAGRIAGEVRRLCIDTLAGDRGGTPERYWLEATMAEAALVMGNLDVAREDYRRAATGSLPGAVEVSRTRTQARFLLECLGRPTELLDDCFVLPRIGVFSGHMLDHPGRAEPRFPAVLEAAVRREMAKRLRRLNIQSGFCSLACGGDLLFAEALLERGGEVFIVLPFGKDDFKRISVEIVPGADWGDRFDRVMKQAASVSILSDKGDPDDPAHFKFSNLVLSGQALLYSRYRGMDVAPLVLWDGKDGDGPGGTQDFAAFWRERGAPLESIRLDALLKSAIAEGLEIKPVAAAASEPPDSRLARVPQEIRAMLFTDVVGFSKWPEKHVPAFVEAFFGRVRKVMRDTGVTPVYSNTWGDAICCVFDDVASAGNFALALQTEVRATDWKALGMPEQVNLRIALHAGPVYRCFDSLLGRETFNGSHVNRAARIEPITEEGQIFASRSFAALSAAHQACGFVCDYAGTRDLPKKAGRLSVFLVRPATG